MSELNPVFDVHLNDLPEYDSVLEAQQVVSLQPKDLEN